MSQSRNPTDTQALLQSMLQKLKLQSGREGHTYQHRPVPATASSTWGQDGKGGGSNSSPTNGFKFPTNGIQSKKFGSSAAESTFGFEGGEIQQAGHGSEVDRGLVSFPTQKDNIGGDKGENRVLGQATQLGITPSGTGQLFPAKPLKDAVITSSGRTDGERVSFGRSAMTNDTQSNKDAVTSMGQNQDQKQGFTTKVYMWSPKSADANPDKGGHVLHMGNGGFGALAQNKDMQTVTADQKTSTSSLRRKQQRPSENKTRRWTQKLKERWRDRPGSFGKKGKEEDGREEQKSGQATEISPQNQLLTAANKEEETTPLSLDSSNPSKPPEDGTNGGNMRSVSDFEFSLGSFSLLEEITTGQKWANFLNPNQSAANQRPSEQLKISPDLHDSSQSSVILNHQGGVNNQWRFRSTEASPVWDYSMAQISPEHFLPASMDVSEGKQQQQYVHREADQSEPMEHGHTQVVMQSGGSVQRRRPPSFVQADDNSALKSRLHLNRKRQHQSVEMRDETDTKGAGRDGFISPLSLSSNAMEEAGESQHDDSILKSPPLSPASLSPSARAPKGVLKHSISQDSEASMEVVTKRRRVEENRRVRFSEEVLAIDPPELDLDATDSEKDSGSEEDSVIEQDCEVEQPVIEEVSPARRPALPAWILALKKRNTGKKHR
ncbi:hypothetical protein D5F01_LYC15563 [Larimichthys crocea]|uniref:Uncharacterized protein n=1 Tax=Larimichthys crocea TaxID=215358 RepID=A0A6G0I380_LARCR|nr:hypothetical protein D5F01_LYC15563 [Larimichthys crocea]